MNYNAIESFVDFCDNLIITQEGLFDKFKKKKKQSTSHREKHTTPARKFQDLSKLTEDQLKVVEEKLAKYIPIIKKEFSRIDGIDFYDIPDIMEELEFSDSGYVNIAYTDKYPNGNCADEEIDNATDWTNDILHTCDAVNAKFKEICLDTDWDKFEGNIAIAFKSL